MSPREQAVYDQMTDQLAAVVGGANLAAVPNRIAQMMRLRQSTSGYVPDDNGVTQRIGDSKVAAARSIVCDTLAGENRVVVFAHFRQEISDLEAAIRKAEPKGTVIMQITGDTQDRQSVV